MVGDGARPVSTTGYEGVPDSTWWTGTLLPAMEKYPVAYVSVSYTHLDVYKRQLSERKLFSL